MQHSYSGKINSGLITKIAVGVVLVFAGIFIYGARLTANRHINNLQAKQDDCKNVLTSAKSQVRQIGGVTARELEIFERTVEQYMQGRYGEGGVNAAFVAIAEQNVQLSPEVTKKLKQVMEAGATKFEAAQRELLQARKTAKDFFTGTMQGDIAVALFGYDPEKDTKIELLTDAATQADYANGVLTDPDPFRGE